MTVPWSHPLLLRGEAAVVDNATEADARPWIGPGVHLRVRCHPALGLPLCPFTVFDGGRAGPVGQPQPVDGVVALPGASVVAAELAAPDKAIAALDAGRIASERRSPPFVVSTVGMSAVQAFSGPVRFYSWQPSPAGPASTAVLDAFGPPFPIGPWWSGPPAGHKDPPQRVQAGQLRVPPYDDTGINPVELASTQFSMVAGDVQAIWATPVGPGGAPVQQRVTKAMPSTTGAHDATADLDASSLIWASSLEAPASRWWGFATTLDPGVVNAPYGDGVQCVIVAALWAVPALPPPAPNQPDLGALVAAAARDPFASSIEAALAVQHAGLSTVIPPLRAAGLQVVPLWTVVATTPIPSSAPSTAPTSYTTTWAQDGTWSAQIRYGADDYSPLIGLRPQGGAWSNVAGNDPVTFRRPIVRVRPPDPAATSNVVVQHLAADGPAVLEIWRGDQWGRWIGPSLISIDPPRRPPPPTPSLRLDWSPSAAGSDTAPASPGTVNAVAQVPDGGANGSPAITAVTATLVGATPATLSLQLEADGWTATAAADPTTPGQTAVVEATAVSVAADGSQSPPSTTASLPIADPRVVVAPATSRGLVFASPCRPDGTSEVDLRFNPPAVPAGTRWRLYVGDERALGASAEPCRATRGDALQRITPDRSRMVALPDPAAEAQSDGSIRLHHVVPGHLEALHVLQVVPVTPAGIETPSVDCGCFVVAAPLLDVPPSPTVTLSFDPATPLEVRMHIDVTLAGARTAVAPRSLLVRGATASASLVARIRRTTAGARPEVAPTRAIVTLAPDADTSIWRWGTDWIDHVEPAAAWAPITYWVEVGWPDEPAFEPGTVPLAATVTQFTSRTSPDSQPSRWSDASVPGPVVVAGPTAPPTATFVAGPPPAIDVAGLTASHPAGAPWTAVASDGATGVFVATGHGPSVSIPLRPAASPTAAWRIAVTSPDGRASGVVALT